ENKKRYLRLMQQEALPDDLAEEFINDRKLGPGMLQNYFEYSRTADQGWKPYGIEMDFEVPIRDAEGNQLYVNHKGDTNTDPELAAYTGWGKEQHPVVYRGRVDLLVQIENEYWI